jgi:catechol 2,3-dioxygenase-like lactoylglutathione lyase family enzyme
MLMKLQFIVVHCSDMKRSVAFYRDRIGFPVKSESPEWTEFHSGSTTLARSPKSQEKFDRLTFYNVPYLRR